MITDNDRKLSVIAYYFSKFDRDAMTQLGYAKLTHAYDNISKQFNKDNSYFRRRMNEFDAISGSHRKGYVKEVPNVLIENFHNGLKNYSFEELTEIVRGLIEDDNNEIFIPNLELEKSKEIITKYSEEEIEAIINSKDSYSQVLRTLQQTSERVFDCKIQNSLKNLYFHKCQICGASAMPIYGVDIIEAHHIELFSKTANNNANNIMILCPDHHRIIHKAEGIFYREQGAIEFQNGKVEKLMYNVHL